MPIATVSGDDLLALLPGAIPLCLRLVLRTTGLRLVARNGWINIAAPECVLASRSTGFTKTGSAKKTVILGRGLRAPARAAKMSLLCEPGELARRRRPDMGMNGVAHLKHSQTEA
jgi:hypothetical protein